MTAWSVSDMCHGLCCMCAGLRIELLIFCGVAVSAAVAVHNCVRKEAEANTYLNVTESDKFWDTHCAPALPSVSSLIRDAQWPSRMSENVK